MDLVVFCDMETQGCTTCWT